MLVPSSHFSSLLLVSVPRRDLERAPRRHPCRAKNSQRKLYHSRRKRPNCANQGVGCGPARCHMMPHGSSPPIEPSAKGSASFAPTGLLPRLRERHGPSRAAIVTAPLVEAPPKRALGQAGCSLHEWHLRPGQSARERRHGAQPRQAHHSQAADQRPYAGRGGSAAARPGVSVATRRRG